MSTELMPPAAEGAVNGPRPPVEPNPYQAPTIDEAVSTEQLSTPIKRLILGTLLVTTAINMLGTAFLPYLMLKQPLLLLLTSADGRNLVLVAQKLGLPLTLAVALPRRVLAMLVTYGVGRLYGRAMLDWSTKKMPRFGKLAVGFERLFLRFRPLVLLGLPTYTSAAIAGVTRTCWQAFVPWMVIGQVLYIAAAFLVADAAAGMTEWLGAVFEKYLWQTTAVFVVAVATQQLIAYVRRRRAAQRAGQRAGQAAG